VALVLQGEDLLYLNGYGEDFKCPEDFLTELAIEAEKANAVITLSEFGYVDDDFSKGLVLCVAQTPSYYRCRVFSLADGTSYDVFENPLRIELPATNEGVDNTCYLMGMESLLHSFFV
jgi:hypothetical protein